MARIRNIKPEFFTDEDIADLEPMERLFYIGLWTQADRAGLLEDKPRSLKARIFPYDNFDAESAINHLESLGFIKRYAAGDVTAIWIIKFLDHQYISKREPQSSLLLYLHEHGTGPILDESCTGTKPVLDQSDTGLSDKDMDEDKDKDTKKRAAAKSSKQNPEPEPKGWPEFWAAYPKKVGRLAALKAWSHITDPPPLPQLLAALEAAKHSRQWQKDNGEFIPNPATWLNGRKWEDVPTPALIPDAGCWVLRGPCAPTRPDGYPETVIPVARDGRVQWFYPNHIPPDAREWTGQ